MRTWLLGLFLGVALAALAAPPPNIVIFFADDLGYGDLSVYGHPTIRTPQLDRMAAEGQRWTNFYVAANVCTPSRAALLTGRYPIRSGTAGGVFFPYSLGGLPQSEVTIAEILKARGYVTAAVGKWHLGHHPEFLPMRQGFDTYFGIPYSNDMDPAPDAPPGRAAFLNPKIEYWNVPLLRNEQIVERPADQNTITRRYTEEAVRFIRANKDRPFFLYLAHNLPHVPLFRGKAFVGVSERGLYGDVVQEVDWSAGQVLEALRETGVAGNTLVVFTSDNGPWLTQFEQGGSAGLLRGGKGSTWEGGQREPAIFWWPGTIAPAVVEGIGSTLDLLPTIASLTGAQVPTDRVIDGLDLTATLLRNAPSPRNQMIFYRENQVFAARLGDYKAHFATQEGFSDEPAVRHDPPLLFHLGHDPSEQYDVAKDHPDVIARIRELVEKHKASIKPVEDQISKREPRRR